MSGRRPGAERGQVMVLFALAITTLIAAVGLVIDGGGLYAQRRVQQSAADMAALAAANDFLIHDDVNLAVARGLEVAAANGFGDGSGGVTVAIGFSMDDGARFTVTIGAPHANVFAGIVGMPTWPVATTATALTGFPDTAVGGPFIFNISAFTNDGLPLGPYGDAAVPFGFAQTSGDAPRTAPVFGWTNYGTGNVNTTAVHGIITGAVTIRRTLTFGEYIGQRNSGNHTALFNDVATYLIGKDVPAPVVDDNGGFMGWAVFHVDHVDLAGNADGSGGQGGGNGTPLVYGWFRNSAVSSDLTIDGCAHDDCPRYLGAYVLRLVN